MQNAEAVEQFRAVTGATREAAARYLEQSGGDLDIAIVTFLESDETGGEDAASDALPAGGPPPAESLAAVDSIVGDLRDPSKGIGKGSGKDSGKDAGKAGGSPENAVAVVFFADGFMVDEEFEPNPPEPEVEQAAAPAPKRVGMMSLSDLNKEGRGNRGPMPKLPKLKPLRPYDTPGNKEFLDQIKAGRVPTELQKRDPEGKPIPVSIAIEDARPKTYEELARIIKQMEDMQKEEEQEQGGAQAAKKAPTLFAGAGNTLSSSSSATASGGAPAAPGGGGGPGATPELVALLSRPVPEADESKPCANIQLRLSSGSRVKARLNLDHTIADLWRVVAAHMGPDAFRSASSHQLVAGFPPKPLADLSATLASADLANAAVTHRCQ